MDINSTRTPPKGVLQCFLGTATLMKMSNMLHIEVPTAILNKWKSVRRRGGTVSRTLSQGLSQVFLVMSPRVHPQGTHTICFWTASDCCLSNRCNVMVNVLYLQFAPAVPQKRYFEQILAEKRNWSLVSRFFLVPFTRNKVLHCLTNKMFWNQTLIHLVWIDITK